VQKNLKVFSPRLNDNGHATNHQENFNIHLKLCSTTVSSIDSRRCVNCGFRIRNSWWISSPPLPLRGLCSCVMHVEQDNFSSHPSIPLTTDSFAPRQIYLRKLRCFEFFESVFAFYFFTFESFLSFCAASSVWMTLARSNELLRTVSREKDNSTVYTVIHRIGNPSDSDTSSWA
jgi:hypothetical protein